MNLHRIKCKCCTSTECCPCFNGEDKTQGGCCYSNGDRIRLTMPRLRRPETYFGGQQDFCFQSCDPPGISVSFCCGFTPEIPPGDDWWAEYEWAVINCLEAEVPDGVPIVPTPLPTPGYPAGPEAGGGPFPEVEPPPNGSGEIYCHRVLVFVLVEISPSLQDYLAIGGDTNCVLPLEWHYYCSGCIKFPNQVGCSLPGNHSPDSELPCGYILPAPPFDLYLPAKPALGWGFVCEPDAPCEFCIGACNPMPPGPCFSVYSDGESITSGMGAVLCGATACPPFEICPACGVAEPFQPDCQTQITFDLASCDGGVICCHPKFFTRTEGCNPDVSGYDCLPGEMVTSTLRRVPPAPSCIWEESIGICRTRTGSDPIPVEPVDPACPEPPP